MLPNCENGLALDRGGNIGHSVELSNFIGVRNGSRCRENPRGEKEEERWEDAVTTADGWCLYPTKRRSRRDDADC